MLFKLYELSIGRFAIVAANEETSKFPFKIFGYITVFQNDDNSYYVGPSKGMISEEVEKSGEVDALKKLAISITEEAVADEF